MVKAISGFFRILMLVVTIFTSIAYLATCLIPYVDTGIYWYVSILGLGFLLLLAFLVLLLLFWVFLRSRIWIFCLVVLLSGSQQIGVAIAFYFPKQFHIPKEEKSLRVMQWNVHNWNQILFENERNFDQYTQPDMIALIKKYNADVLCIEEFFESTNPQKLASNIRALRVIGYPYHYFSHGDLHDQYYLEGIAIFSKYPIINAGEIELGNKSSIKPLAFADITFGKKNIRVIAIHLQSVRFVAQDYSNLSKLKRVNDPSLSGGKTVLSKLRNGFRKRYDQSIIVNDQIGQSPYPVILCGDFNDVPNSGVYFNIRKNLQDAFLKKGTGIGRTFRFISPTLRIDYIMSSKQFDITQFARLKVPYSDHYPLIADLHFKKGS